MNKVYRGPSIDASYQVSVHLVEGFQRRRLKCEKLTDDGRQTTDNRRRTPSDGKDGHFKSIKSKVEMKYSTFCIVMHVLFLFLFF
jgi:hypothetical protein